MSGKKGRSGRKGKAEIAGAREMFRSVNPQARRKKMIEHLAKLAEQNDLKKALAAQGVARASRQERGRD